MRIPGSKVNPPSENKPAVLMMHGLQADASQWVLNSQDKAPAFILARAGFDVWMGNNRGCLYGLLHKTLDAKDDKDMPEFFDFSFEEMGTRDVPAFTKFIQGKIGKKKIGYLGHSEGTT